MTPEEFLEQLGVPKEELKNLPWFDYGNLLTWLEDYSDIKTKEHDSKRKSKRVT